MGTVFNQKRAISATIPAGLQDADLNVIMTVGRNNDPAAVGPRREHIHVEHNVPMPLLLPDCYLVAEHRGFNSTITTPGAGLPILFIPIVAARSVHAQRRAAIGVGRVVRPAEDG